MRTFVFATGILVILDGLAILIRPGWYPAVVRFFTRGRLVYIPAAVKTAFGIMLLVAATSCSQALAAVILGLLICAGNLAIFVVRIEKVHRLLTWLSQRTGIFYRLMGITAVLFGSLLAWIAGIPQ